MPSSTIDRRGFLKAAGAAGVATVAAGCDYNAPVPIGKVVPWLEDPVVPYENVLPYVVQDPQLVPGNAVHFATRCDECPAGCGVVARNREGRIVHLEGNPHDPVGGGNLCAMGTAGIQATYSPDRFKGPLKAGAEVSWDDAIQQLGAAIKGAAGAVAWVGRYRSAATGALIAQAVQAFGGRVLMWEPLGLDALRAAVKATFGRDAIPSWHLDDAHTVLSFGADFTTTWLSPNEQSRGWANSRDPKHGGFVSRTVVVAPRLGNSGVLADLHLAPKPGTEVDVAMALARLVADRKGYRGPAGRLLSGVDPDAAASSAGISAERLGEVADWLAAAPSVVIPGGPADSIDPTALATAVLVLNEVCGNIGRTVRFGDEHLVDGHATAGDVVALLDDCRNGKVKVLFIDDLDLVYSLPESMDVQGALARVDHLVLLTNEPGDTTIDKAWVLPPGTTLENWGDGNVRAGVYTLQQQAMRPLYATRSQGDVLLALARAAGVAAPAAQPAGADAAPA
ncbi:MAG: twin-arginine translocation signal domain-containing protein, partial [Deltaproteobacteria bacterium]